MRCDQCRHWKQQPEADAPWEATSAGLGHCGGVRERWVIQDEVRPEARLNSAAWIAARERALQQARAYVEDGSEYKANLFTAPDFFCALFDQK